MYKTGYLKVKTQILQTIFAELPKTAKKMKLTIRFDDEEKLNMFKRLEAQRKQDDEEFAELQSSSDQEDDSQIHEKDTKEGKQSKDKSTITKDNEEKNRETKKNKKEVNLENSIIYKQFYEKQFERIGLSFDVKIKIRAQKITFQGCDIDDIEEAMEKVEGLIDNIEVQYIHKYGTQMSQSYMITNKLDKVGIKVFRILDKYYRWWQISPELNLDARRQRKQQIQNTLSQIDFGIHCLQYLYSVEEDITAIRGSHKNEFLKNRQKLMVYRPILLQLKGKIFQKELTYKINESSDPDQMQVQLSISRQALVFHSNANEYLQMSIKQVRVKFQQYDYFFLTIDSDNKIQEAIQILKTYQYDRNLQKTKNKPIYGEIEDFKDINYIHFTTNYEKVKKTIQEKLNSPKFQGFTTLRQAVTFCIGFIRKSPERRLEYLCEILQKLQNAWKGASYKISICLQKSEELECNYLSYEYEQSQKIFHLTANQSKIQNNLMILRDFVINQKLKLRKPDDLTEEYDQNVTISTVNVSQQIQDSTILHERSMSQDMNTTALLDAMKNQQQGYENEPRSNDNAQKDQKCLHFLSQYKVFIEETNKEYNEKYKDEGVKEGIILKTDKRNRGLQDELVKVTNSKFQVLKIKLNPKHKVQEFYGVQKDQIVTVFVPAKMSPFTQPKQAGLKILQGMYDSFPIKLIGHIKDTLNESGYLINVRKENIDIEGKGFKIKYGAPFQVAKQIVYLKQN